MSVLRRNEIWETVDKYSLTFDCEIPLQLLCIICRNVVRDCKKLPCGCRFCSNCLEKYINSGNSCCPGLSEFCQNQTLTLQEVEVDDDTNNEIGELMMKCGFNGCFVREHVKNIPNHIRNCQFLIETCPQCGVDLVHCDILEHFQNQCNETSIQCRFCGSLMSRRLLETVHYNVNNEELCDMFESLCPYDCAINIIVKVKDHLRVCQNRPLSCPYFDVGCGSGAILQSFMKAHLCKEGYCHAGLLLKKINNLANEMQRLRTTVETSNSKISLLEAEVRRIQLENEELRNQVTGGLSEALVAEANEETRIQKSMIVALSKRMDLGELNYETKYSEYIWQLTGFKDLLASAKNDVNFRRISDGFLTSNYGYKVQMILFPLGWQGVRNRYMSLYFQLIKDKYDALLPWPFRQNVELCLLDQGGGNNQIVNLFYDPTNEVMMENYQRPLSVDVRMYGSPDFVPLALFRSQPSLVRNDSIFIKFCAKPIFLVD